MEQTLEQAAKQWHGTHGIYASDGINKTIVEAFKAGAEWMKKQISEYLDKWMEHATRGSEKGNHIYHLGKIDLILAIQEWLKEEDL